MRNSCCSHAGASHIHTWRCLWNPAPHPTGRGSRRCRRWQGREGPDPAPAGPSEQRGWVSVFAQLLLHSLLWAARRALLPPLPRAPLVILLPLQRRRNRRKKVNRCLIISCLLSFRANSAHTKIILHNKRNIYLKKTQRCMASLKI